MRRKRRGTGSFIPITSAYPLKTYRDASAIFLCEYKRTASNNTAKSCETILICKQKAGILFPLLTEGLYDGSPVSL